MDQTNNNTSNTLIDAIVEGVRRKKGESIVDLDMIMLENSQCDHFIICHGIQTPKLKQ
jgi:ribosome-associated protein